MANNAPAFGSGRHRRPDPISQIGPGFDSGVGDPVADMPEGLPDLAAPLARIEAARILRGTARWQGVGLRLQNHDPASMLFEVFLTAGEGRDMVIAVLDEEDAVAA